MENAIIRHAFIKFHQSKKTKVPGHTQSVGVCLPEITP